MNRPCRVPTLTYARAFYALRYIIDRLDWHIINCPGCEGEKVCPEAEKLFGEFSQEQPKTKFYKKMFDTPPVS